MADIVVPMLSYLPPRRIPVTELSVSDKHFVDPQAVVDASKGVLEGRSIVKTINEVAYLLREVPSQQEKECTLENFVKSEFSSNTFAKDLAMAFAPNGDRKKLPTITWRGTSIQAHDARIYRNEKEAVAAAHAALVERQGKEGAASDATFLLIRSPTDQTCALIEYRENAWTSIDGDDVGMRIKNAPPYSRFIDHEGTVYYIEKDHLHRVASVEEVLVRGEKGEEKALAPRTTQGALAPPSSTSGVSLSGR